MKTKRSLAPLASVALVALALLGCTKTDDVGTGPSPTAVSDTSPGSTTPPSKESPDTSAPKKSGTTVGPGDSAMAPNTHEVEFSDGTTVEGDMSCSYGNKHLRLILLGFDDGSRVTIDTDPEPGAESDEGEYVLRSKTNGNPLAKGPANVSASVYDTTADGRDAQGLVFSFSARFTATGGGESGTVTGQGSCIVEGDRIGGNKPAAGGGSLSMPVTDASEFIDNLVRLAMKDAQPNEEAFGATKIWVAEGLSENVFKGSGLKATATSISGFSTYEDKNSTYRAYPFAVSDGSNCAYGVIFITEENPEPVGKTFDADGDCTGDAALESFEKNVLGK